MTMIDENENLANIPNTSVPKNFRQHADVEAFYRFIFENDLRQEALEILDEVRQRKNLIKAQKARVKQ